VKTLPHRLQATGGHGIQAGAAQGIGIGEPMRRAAASVEVGSEVQSMHGHAM
jgi:hypothetical protein